ncbi:MAG: alpha-L-rhamnosidase, partial [Aristaeellaceae bacterium]
DKALFEEYRDGCTEAYRQLVTLPGYTLDTDRQAKLVRPLYMRLLDEKQTDFSRKRFVKAMDNYGWRVGTGFLSTPIILDVLADMDIAYAYRLLENEDIPGWLFMPKNGATTIWEFWEGTKTQGGIASLNHHAKGAVCEWLFRTICGIRVDGENHFTIAPHPG